MHDDTLSQRHSQQLLLLALTSVALLLQGIDTALSGETTAEPSEATEPSFTVENFKLIAGDKPGSVELSFTVDAPPGTRFFLSYQHGNVRGASSTYHVWETAGPEPTDVKISMGYRPDFNGDRTVSVLSSQEKNVDFRVVVTNCKKNAGISTIVSAPIFSVAAEERVLKVVTDFTDAEATMKSGDCRLLSVTRKMDGEPHDTMPSTQMHVGLYKDTPIVQPTPQMQLLRRWKQQHQEIGSAHIKYRCLRQGSGELIELNRDQVNAILAEFELNDHPEAFPDAARKLLDRPEIMDKPWSELEFHCIGLKTRENADWYTRVFDGELDLKFGFANKQIDVQEGRTSRIHRTTLADFRILGLPDNAELEAFEIKSLPSGRILLERKTESSSSEWLADLTTGFIRHRLSISRHNAGIEQASEDYQYAPTTFHGGIVFPKLMVRTRYVKDSLTSLEMRMLDNVELNEGFPRDTFKLAAKADTKVLIYGEDTIAEPAYMEINVDTPDVAAAVREHQQQKAEAAAK